MRILITGGLGFIGRELTRQFLEQGGHELVLVDMLSEQVHGTDPDYSNITDNAAVTFIKNDICTPGLLKDALKGVDVVYHLAAETGTGQSMYEIQQYYRTNVMGTALLLEEIVKDPALRPKSLILSSSRSIYGEGAYVRGDATDPETAARHYPMARSVVDMNAGRFEFESDGAALVPVATRETDPADPRSLYAASKLSQEQMCQIACASVDVDYVALRLQNVYGPGQSLRNPYTGILSIFTNILRRGGKIDIFEDGEESRDFVFVSDVARAFRAAVNLAPDAPRVLNVGMGHAYTVTEMVRMLEKKMDRPNSSAVSGRFRPGDIRHNYADITRMRDHLGFVPEVDLREGLSRTVDWAMTQPIEEDRSVKATEELKSFFKAKDA
ncbi:MAG: epimerase [Alteromonadaceae bacterium]|nr:epimerase [Alteromonadaceae bacterium]|tara:strand:- start:1530 stop:2678 length:1149 start_codon:yes stop_codon:yes gene_type:complete